VMEKNGKKLREKGKEVKKADIGDHLQTDKGKVKCER